jgi:hypothetical protein
MIWKFYFGMSVAVGLDLHQSAHRALCRDLKSEARRICILDHTAILESPHLDERPVDYESIVSTTGKASLYLRSSKYGIDKPQLFEDVGAYYADDVVPMNLHNEVW